MKKILLFCLFFFSLCILNDNFIEASSVSSNYITNSGTVTMNFNAISYANANGYELISQNCENWESSEDTQRIGYAIFKVSSGDYIEVSRASYVHVEGIASSYTFNTNTMTTEEVINTIGLKLGISVGLAGSIAGGYLWGSSDSISFGKAISIGFDDSQSEIGLTFVSHIQMCEYYVFSYEINRDVIKDKNKNITYANYHVLQNTSSSGKYSALDFSTAKNAVYYGV